VDDDYCGACGSMLTYRGTCPECDRSAVADEQLELEEWIPRRQVASVETNGRT
jgi:hypothetical protein